MKLSEIILWTNAKASNKDYKDKKINKISIDTRNLEKGDVFFAIKTSNGNGHRYIKEAFEKGAIAVVVSERPKIPSDNLLIKVEDTSTAILLLAKCYKEQFKIPYIAVTGSVGKTTTKELISLILSTKYKVLKNETNYNSIYGLSLTLFNLKKEHEIAVTELGMNHLGEISELSNCLNPTSAVITTIGTSHIGYLKSKKNILKAKLEILDGMDTNSTLFVNGDDEYLETITPTVKTIKCGFTKANDFEGFGAISDLYLSTFNLEYNHEIYEVEVNLPGHLLTNVLLAIRVGLEYGISIEEIIKVLKTYRSPDMRMSIEKLKNKITLIDDCYNASFESIKGILEILAHLDDDKILILGEIKELGKYSKKIHKDLKEYIVNIIKREIILVGKDMRHIKISGASYFDDNMQVIEYLKTKNINEKLILVKGSRGVELDIVCDYLRETY